MHSYVSMWRNQIISRNPKGALPAAIQFSALLLNEDSSYVVSGVGGTQIEIENKGDSAREGSTGSMQEESKRINPSPAPAGAGARTGQLPMTVQTVRS